MRSFAAKQSNLHVEENMSNLTSASNEASVCSSNRADINGGVFSPARYSFPPLPDQPPPPKKKRNQPGHPDPDAEVIALSPRSLLATNRFVCEICSKGFQRDQNLQLHRRGHNLPWKLKQRPNKDVIRKKVYVCPEASCVHHDPARALGDLTGIKKHFCRKHGEKKWKCDKCSKKYAVHSDWKAHSKTCGTREYRCDCGALFSRRDSFITHRAFCDALAEEGARSIARPQSTTNPVNVETAPSIPPHFFSIQRLPSIKEEAHGYAAMMPPTSDFPPWLSTFHNPPTVLGLAHQMPAASSDIFQDFPLPQNPNTQPGGAATSQLLPTYPLHPPPPPPQISATALLQKAAQMGVKSSGVSPSGVFSGLHQNPPSRDVLLSGTCSHGDKAAPVAGGGTHGGVFQNVILGNHGAYDYHGQLDFEEMAFNMVSSGRAFSRKEEGRVDLESLDFQAAMDEFSRSGDAARCVEGGGACVSDGMTRDFLGF